MTPTQLPKVFAPLFILLIPFCAMQLSIEGWHWDLFDFLLMGSFILGTSLAYQLISRKVDSRLYRVATGIAAISSLLILWVNGAVGIIGSEDNPANLLYFVALGIGFLAVLASKFKPRGMSYALFTTAGGLFLIPIIAFMIWRPDFDPGVIHVFILNTCFATPFFVSGLLFKKIADRN